MSILPHNFQYFMKNMIMKQTCLHLIFVLSFYLLRCCSSTDTGLTNRAYLRRNANVEDVDIPFMITNMNLRKDTNSNGIVKFSSISGPPSDEITLLANVRRIGYLTYEATVVHNASEFKKLVSDNVDQEDSPYNDVMYWIPGMQVQPSLAISLAKEHNNKEDPGSLIIPFVWRNAWFLWFFSYPIDRPYSSPCAGEALAKASDLFSPSNRTYNQSVLLVSQGAFIFRIYASILGKARGESTTLLSPEKVSVFENVFMLAADDRYDLFSADFNPIINNINGTDVNPETSTPEEQIHDINYETERDGGYHITKLVKQQVYVVYNIADVALELRKFVIAKEEGNPTQALGQYGAQAKVLAYSNNYYFPKWVTFVDFSCLFLPGVGHDYVFTPAAYNLYKSQESPCLDAGDLPVVNSSIYKLLSYGTCDTYDDEDLSPIFSLDECETAALDLNFDIKIVEDIHYQDLVDGCSIKDGTSLFLNGLEGTCDDSVNVNHWSYTGCECSEWFPCICKLAG